MAKIPMETEHEKGESEFELVPFCVCVFFRIFIRTIRQSQKLTTWRIHEYFYVILENKRIFLEKIDPAEH